jgi:hypothetical protein
MNTRPLVPPDVDEDAMDDEEDAAVALLDGDAVDAEDPPALLAEFAWLLVAPETADIPDDTIPLEAPWLCAEEVP